MHQKPLKRLTAVWSRDVNPAQMAGRTRMIAAIREQMAAGYRVENLRLTNILERRSLRAGVGTLTAALRSALSGRRPSLQCLLFCDQGNHAEIRRQLVANPPDILYLDGVRTFFLLQSLADFSSKMRIVVDFDDLMSRRMESLGTTGTPLSLGYLQDKIPSFLGGAVALGSISSAVARYEQSALIPAEELIGNWADAVTLISPLEGEVLRERYRQSGRRAAVHIIPPAVDIAAPPQQYSEFSRFFFIGTDTLPQNKLTIQLILDHWRTLRPSAEMHIFGHMVTRWPAVQGVVFRGYVPSLWDVYVPGTVLFAPGVLRGGIKTKVAEAFAHGCAVIGNTITFEGLALNDYPLLVDTEAQVKEIVKTPALFRDRMRQAAATGQQYVKRFLSREQFKRNWNEALG